MSPKQVSPSKMLSFLVITLFLVNAVSSLKCYDCTSEKTLSCISDPPKDSTCEISRSSVPPSIQEALESTPILHSLAGVTDSSQSKDKDNVPHKCAKFEVEFKGKIDTVRMCVPQDTTCEDYRKELEPKNMAVKGCNFCHADLCNSSSSLSITTSVILLGLMSYLFAM